MFLLCGLFDAKKPVREADEQAVVPPAIEMALGTGLGDFAGHLRTHDMVQCFVFLGVFRDGGKLLPTNGKLSLFLSEVGPCPLRRFGPLQTTTVLPLADDWECFLIG